MKSTDFATTFLPAGSRGMPLVISSETGSEGYIHHAGIFHVD